MIDLVLVRHGESIRNKATGLAHSGDFGLLNEQFTKDDYEPGWPLTERGWEQARATGQWLREQIPGGFDFGYVSPYLRALQTARGLDLGVSFEQDWRLRERHWGDFSDPKTLYPPEQYLKDLGKCLEPDWKTSFPGAESLNDLLPQVRSFVVDRLSGMRAGKVLIVSHGGTLRAMQTIMDPNEDPMHDPHLTNASVLHYRLEEVAPDGHVTGELQQACPWLADKEPSAWFAIP